jgi:hypothetical protein
MGWGGGLHVETILGRNINQYKKGSRGNVVGWWGRKKEKEGKRPFYGRWGGSQIRATHHTEIRLDRVACIWECRVQLCD